MFGSLGNNDYFCSVVTKSKRTYMISFKITMKKTFFISLLAMLPLASNAEAFKVGALWYELDDDPTVVKVVASEDEPYSGAITIESSIEYQGNNYTVVSIGESAFEGCDALTSITLPAGIERIEQGAFFGCCWLTTMLIPNGVKKIGLGAFSECARLTYVSIPNSVTSIDQYAFDKCPSLTRIDCEIQKPFAINENVFDSQDAVYDVYSIATLVVPDGTKSTYQSTAGWLKFSNIVEASNVGEGGSPGDLIRVDNIYYRIGNNNTVSVKSGEVKYSDKVDIPDKVTYNYITYNVTSIEGSAFMDCTELTSVTIPNSVTTIGANAFSGCSNLTSITIPGSITKINSQAFFNCNKLTSVYITDLAAWCKISFATDLANPLRNGSSLFLDDSELVDIVIPSSVTSIGQFAFNGCKALLSVTIPNSVTSIGKKAFYDCNNLTTIISKMENPCDISNSEVFNNNKSYLVVPAGKRETYQTRGWDIFDNIIEDGEGGNSGMVFSIDGNTYKIDQDDTVVLMSGDTKLSGEIVIPSQVEFLGKNYSIISIGESAFEGNTNLTSVTIPIGVKAIGQSAFEGCTGLADVIIPSSVETIEQGAFYGCSALTSIKIPDGVTTIPVGAFTATNLTCIIIPRNVTSIGEYAFERCTNLKRIVLEMPAPIAINQSVFYNNENVFSLATLVVPDGAKDAYKSTDVWENFTIISEASEQKARTVEVVKAGTLSSFISDIEKYHIEELTLKGELNGTDFLLIRDMAGVTYQERSGSPRYPTTDGKLRKLDISDVSIVSGGMGYTLSTTGPDSHANTRTYTEGVEVYTEDHRISHMLFAYTKLETVTLPNNVISIDSWAFESCENLASMTIPSSVTSIGNYAFYGCGLTTITIPDGVTNIGISPFASCSGLTSIVVGSNNTKYDSRNNCNAIIEKSSNILIAGCLNTIIPNDVTSIGNSAFAGISGLTSITIPSSVTSIGNSAFYGCNSLTHIISEIETPFAIGADVFNSDIYATALLTVPSGKESDYRATEGWKKFTHIIEVGNGGLIGQEFQVDDILYKIGENNSVSVVSCNTDQSTIEILNEVDYNGKTYSVTSIGNGAFKNSTGLISVTIPATIISIGLDAFEDCNSLTAVKISNLAAWCNITFANHYSNPLYRAHHLFLNGNEVTDLVIPEAINSIGGFAFINCSSLKSIVIPESVTTIGVSAFYGCSSLISLTIPKSVTSIGETGEYYGTGVFGECTKLTSITSLNTTPPTSKDGRLIEADYDKCVVWVPKGCSSAYQNAAGWKDFKNIKEIFDGDVTSDGKISKADVDALVAYIMGKAPEGFNENQADVNGDKKKNVADVVKLIDLLASYGLSVESQLYFKNVDGKQVINSLTFTLKNNRDEAIQLTKCELYCNKELVSSKTYPEDSANMEAGGSIEITFNNLADYASRNGFSVCWYYISNGVNYVYRYTLTD